MQKSVYKIYDLGSSLDPFQTYCPWYYLILQYISQCQLQGCGFLLKYASHRSLKHVLIFTSSKELILFFFFSSSSVPPPDPTYSRISYKILLSFWKQNGKSIILLGQVMPALRELSTSWGGWIFELSGMHPFTWWCPLPELLVSSCLDIPPYIDQLLRYIWC